MFLGYCGTKIKLSLIPSTYLPKVGTGQVQTCNGTTPLSTEFLPSAVLSLDSRGRVLSSSPRIFYIVHCYWQLHREILTCFTDVERTIGH